MLFLWALGTSWSRRTYWFRSTHWSRGSLVDGGAMKNEDNAEDVHVDGSGIEENRIQRGANYEDSK